MNPDKKQKQAVDRRKFLKQSVLAGAGLTALGLGASNETFAKSGDGKAESKITEYYPFRVHEYERIEDVIDIHPDYKRMNQKNTIFSRGGWDPKFTFGDGEDLMASLLAYRKGMVLDPLIATGTIGWGPVEAALNHASGFSMEEATGLSSVGVRNGGPFADWEVFSNPKVKDKHHFKSPEEAA
jgi:hypothetical protein